jgi:hypothetical protein
MDDIGVMKLGVLVITYRIRFWLQVSAKPLIGLFSLLSLKTA